MGKNIAKTVRSCRNIMEKAYIILENTCFCVLISIAAGCLILSFVLVRWDHKGFLKKGNSRNYSTITTEGPKFTRLMSSEKYKNVISSIMFYQMDESKLKPPILKYNAKIKDQVGILKLHKKRSKRLARDILNKNIDNQEIELDVKYKYQSIVSSSTITTTEIKTLRKKHKSSRVKNRTVIKNNTYNPNIKLIKSNEHKNILRRRNHLTSNSNYQATTEKNLRKIVGKLRKKSTLRHRNYHRAKHSGKIKRDQVMSISESSTDHIQSFTSNLLPTEKKTTDTTYKTISTAFYSQTTKSRNHTTKPYETNPSMKADETDTASITTEPINVIIFPNATDISNTSYLATTPLKPATSSSSVKATISSSAAISISDVISTSSIEPTTSFTTTKVNSYSTINTSFSNKPSTAATNLIIETTIFKIVSPSTTSISTFYTTKITTDSTIITTTRNFSNAKFSSLPFPITSPRVETTSTTTSIPTRTLNTSDIISSTNITNSPTKILSIPTSTSIVSSAITSLTMKTTTTPGTTSSTRWLTSTSPLIPDATLTSISKLTKPASPIISTIAVSTNKSTAIVLTTGLKPTMRPPPKFKRQHDPTEELMSKPYMRLVIPTLPTFIGLTMIGTGMLICMRLNSLCCVPCIGVTDRP